MIVGIRYSTMKRKKMTDKNKEKAKDVSKDYADVYQKIDSEMEKKFGSVPLMVMCFVDPTNSKIVGATNITEEGKKLKKVLINHLIDLYGGDLEHIDFSKKKPN